MLISSNRKHILQAFRKTEQLIYKGKIIILTLKFLSQHWKLEDIEKYLKNITEKGLWFFGFPTKNCKDSKSMQLRTSYKGVEEICLLH